MLKKFYMILLLFFIGGSVVYFGIPAQEYTNNQPVKDNNTKESLILLSVLSIIAVVLVFVLINALNYLFNIDLTDQMLRHWNTNRAQEYSISL